MVTPVNAITIRGTSYLLAWVGGDDAHLVKTVGAGEPSRAIAQRDHGASLNHAYSESELTSPRWSMRTLCGRNHWCMAATEAGREYQLPQSWDDSAVYAPTCRQCLRILDLPFADREPDDRLQWNVIRCVEELELWGSFVVDGVPLEQMTLLRDRVRAEARRRRWQFTSRVWDQRLMGVSENSVERQRKKVVDHDADERMRGTERPKPSWHFSW